MTFVCPFDGLAHDEYGAFLAHLNRAHSVEDPDDLPEGPEDPDDLPDGLKGDQVRRAVESLADGLRDVIDLDNVDRPMRHDNAD